MSLVDATRQQPRRSPIHAQLPGTHPAQKRLHLQVLQIRSVYTCKFFSFVAFALASFPALQCLHLQVLQLCSVGTCKFFRFCALTSVRASNIFQADRAPHSFTARQVARARLALVPLAPTSSERVCRAPSTPSRVRALPFSSNASEPTPKPTLEPTPKPTPEPTTMEARLDRGGRRLCTLLRHGSWVRGRRSERARFEMRLLCLVIIVFVLERFCRMCKYWPAPGTTRASWRCRARTRCSTSAPS